MPSARDIAEERFARGEISSDEFDSIIAKINDSGKKFARLDGFGKKSDNDSGKKSDNDSGKKSNQDAIQKYEPPEKFHQILKWLGAFIGLMWFASLFYSKSDADDVQNSVTMSNLLVSGDVITFDLAYSGSRKGDLITYVNTSDGKSILCPHIFEMRAGSIKKLSINCPTNAGIEDGLIRWVWADTDTAKTLAPKAVRLPISWEEG